MTRRVDYIVSVDPGSIPDGRGSYFYALVNCLAPAELAELVRRTFCRTKLPREAALRAAVREVEVDDRHRSLFDELCGALLQECHEGAHREALAAAYCIHRLSPATSDRVQERFILTAVDHRYVVVRRRGFKLAADYWTEEIGDAILNSFRRNGDLDASRRLILSDTPERLAMYFDELVSDDLESYLVSKALLKLEPVRPDLVKWVRTWDPISYTYVVAKMRGKLERGEANRLIEENCKDERFGLLLWSLGVLGEWDALIASGPRLEKMY